MQIEGIQAELATCKDEVSDDESMRALAISLTTCTGLQIATLQQKEDSLSQSEEQLQRQVKGLESDINKELGEKTELASELRSAQISAANLKVAMECAMAMCTTCRVHR